MATNDEQQIKVEQYRLLHQQAPASQAGGLLIAAVLMAIMWGAVDHDIMLIWGLVLLIVTAARFGAWYRYKERIDTDEGAASWYRIITVLLLASGCVWASSGWYLYPDSDQLLIGLLIAMSVALIAGAIGPLSSVLSCYVIYITPITFVLSLRLFLDPDIHSITWFAFTSFAVVCILFARNIQTTIIESISLRFENQGLIARLRQNGEQLEIAAHEAQESSAAKSRFLTVASHDLSQPLHALELFISSLKEETDPKQRDKLVVNASRSTKMLSEMFASLLDLSKLEANIVTTELVETSIQQVLTPIINDLTPRTAGKGLVFNFQFDNATITTDTTLLQRILLNLLGNALKFTKEGEISLLGQSTSDHYQITITDTGPGIPADDLQNIFKDYYQIEGHRVGGMGLGLAIVARIAELLDITIDVSSELDQGTSFKLSVPM